MRTAFVVMGHPLFEDRTKVCLRDRDQPVQTLTSYRTDHPFANSIRLRAVRRRFQYPQAQRPDRLIQVRREDAIPVVHQVTVSVFIADDLPQLLQGPLGARVRSDVDSRETATTVLDDHEHIEQPKGRSDQWHYFKRCMGARVEAWREPRYGVPSAVDAAWVVASRPEARLGSVGAARVEARSPRADTRTFG